MKRLAYAVIVALGVMALPSCSAAQGLAKTLGRTASGVGKSVGSLGSSITR